MTLPERGDAIKTAARVTSIPWPCLHGICSDRARAGCVFCSLAEWDKRKRDGGSSSPLTPGAGDATQAAKDGAPGTPTDSRPPYVASEHKFYLKRLRGMHRWRKRDA